MRKPLVLLLIALLPACAGSSPETQGQIPLNMPGASVRVHSILQKMGVQLTDSELKDSGAKQTIQGTKGDLDVLVTIERDDKTPDRQTGVAVSAKKKGSGTEDEAFAKQVLDRMIAS